MGLKESLSIRAGRPLHEKELIIMRSDPPGLHLVTDGDKERYKRLHAGDPNHPPVIPLDPFDTLIGATEEVPSLNPEIVRHDLENTFSDTMTRLFKKGKPTGTENFVFHNGPTLGEAASIYKIPLFQPTSDEAAKKRELVQNFYSQILPDYVPPVRLFQTRSGLHGQVTPNVPKHPELDQAEDKSRVGNPDHLTSIISNSFLAAYIFCEKYKIPFDIEPGQRNFIVTPTGKEVFIDEIRVEPVDIISPKTQYNVFNACHTDPNLMKRRKGIFKIVRELEALEK